MKLVRSMAFYLSVASISVFAVACGGTVEHSPQTSASAGTKAPIGTNTHGLVKVVGDALGEVALRPEQRTEIEKLASDAETRHAPLAEGRKTLMLTVADQIEKGAIDKSALQPQIDKMTADFEAVRTEDRAALVKLHSLLDAEQRNAFVDALQSQMKAKRGDHMDRMAGFVKLKQLADELKLTEEQRTQIHEVMKEGRRGGWGHHGDRAGKEGALGPHHSEWKRGDRKGHHGKHAMEAFRQDKLDLDAVAPPHDAKLMAKFGTDHMTSFAEKVLPILTPEQRKIAADKVRAMAASGNDALLVH